MQNSDGDIMSTNFDVIVIFPVYGLFGAIWKPDFGRIVCRTYVSIKYNLVPYRNEKKEVKNL